MRIHRIGTVMSNKDKEKKTELVPWSHQLNFEQIE